MPPFIGYGSQIVQSAADNKNTVTQAEACQDGERINPCCFIYPLLPVNQRRSLNKFHDVLSTDKKNGALCAPRSDRFIDRQPGSW